MRRSMRGFGLVDLLTVVGVLALLVWMVHFDWAKAPAPATTAAPTATP